MCTWSTTWAQRASSSQTRQESSMMESTTLSGTQYTESIIISDQTRKFNDGVYHTVRYTVHTQRASSSQTRPESSMMESTTLSGTIHKDGRTLLQGPRI